MPPNGYEIPAYAGMVFEGTGESGANLPTADNHPATVYQSRITKLSLAFPRHKFAFQLFHANVNGKSNHADNNNADKH